MASTQTGKPRASLKAPPAAAATPAPKAKGKAAPKTQKVIARKVPGPTMGSAEWQQMVATAAYLRAETRGFSGGSPEQDWLEAEAELLARHPRHASAR